MELKGSVALVTGGASGLGEGASRQLAAAGATIVILDLASSQGGRLAAELGDRGHFVPCDVTRPDDVADGIGWVRDQVGRVDICVNAAGIPDSARLVAPDRTPFPLDVYRRVIDVNLVGTFDVMRNAAVAMSWNEPNPDGERGVIINVASIAGYEGGIGHAAYSASKGGVIAMTLPAARDLARWGIRVVTVCPGAFKTGMWAGLDPRIQDRLARVPVFPKRLGMPAEFGLLVESIVVNPMLNGESIRLDAAARPGPV